MCFQSLSSLILLPNHKYIVQILALFVIVFGLLFLLLGSFTQHEIQWMNRLTKKTQRGSHLNWAKLSCWNYSRDGPLLHFFAKCDTNGSLSLHTIQLETIDWHCCCLVWFRWPNSFMSWSYLSGSLHVKVGSKEWAHIPLLVSGYHQRQILCGIFPSFASVFWSLHFPSYASYKYHNPPKKNNPLWHIFVSCIVVCCTTIA